MASTLKTKTQNINQYSGPSGDQKRSKLYCTTCEHTNHKTEDCRLKGKPKCSYCNHFFHVKEDCQKFSYDKRKAQVQFIKKGKAKMVTQAIAEEQPKVNISKIVDINDASISEIANIPEINNISGIAEEALNVVGKTQFPDLENDDLIDPSNSDKDVNMADANDINAHNYDWLANSGSTLHITNQKKYYQTYIPTSHIIKGVRGKQTHAEGHGTVILCAQHKDNITNLKLQNVLYVPTNKYNLFALGKWDTNGRMY